jgi:hypothetical protein
MTQGLLIRTVLVFSPARRAAGRGLDAAVGLIRVICVP